MIIIKKMIRKYNNNNGTTMVETLVSFVVLVIVFAALFGMIRFSSNLRMRAAEAAKVRNSFNSEIYKSNNQSNVDAYYYIGQNTKNADERNTMFSLKLVTADDTTSTGNATSSRNLDGSENMSVELKDKFSNSIRVPNIDATAYVSTDPLIKGEDGKNRIAVPKVLMFDYHDPTPTPAPTPDPDG